LGLAHLELKQFSEAADQMRQCLTHRDRPALAPINKEIRGAGPRHCLALCLEQLGQAEEAADEYRQAVKDDPRSYPARSDYARFLAAHAQPVEALNLYSALAHEKPDEVRAWLQGGQLALSAPQFLEVAVDWTAEAVQRAPRNPAVLRQRAEALTLAGDCAKALPFWRAAAPPAGQESEALSPLAALVLCETVLNDNQFLPPPQIEEALSREFVKWYQRLVQYHARATAESLNAQVEVLGRFLPSAARLLSAAMADAAEPAMA